MFGPSYLLLFAIPIWYLGHVVSRILVGILTWSSCNHLLSLLSLLSPLSSELRRSPVSLCLSQLLQSPTRPNWHLTTNQHPLVTTHIFNQTVSYNHWENINLWNKETKTKFQFEVTLIPAVGEQKLWRQDSVLIWCEGVVDKVVSIQYTFKLHSWILLKKKISLQLYSRKKKCVINQNWIFY